MILEVGATGFPAHDGVARRQESLVGWCGRIALLLR
jgi:hypothetical protein